MEKRSDEEKRVLRAVADKIKQAAEKGKRKRDLEVESELHKRACGIGLFCAPGLFEHAQRKRDKDTSDEEKRVLRAVADKIKQAAEKGKRKRDLEVESELYKRACGIGLFCAPGLFEHAQRKRDEDTKAVLRAAAEKIKRAEENRKREEDNKVLGDVADTIKKAVEKAEKHRREEQKRNTGGFLSNALNALQRSADMAKRHVERNAEDTTAFRAVDASLKKREENSDVANSIKQAVETTKHRREEEKRNVGGFLNNALNALHRSADMVKRHIERNTGRNEAQERVFREVAGRMKKQAEKNEERKRELRDVMDKVKEAADAYKQKRDEKAENYEEQRRVFRNVAESLKKSALNANNRREQNEVAGKNRRWCTAEGYCTEDVNRRSPGFIEGIKNAFNLVARRHAEFEKRDAASAIKKAVNAATEKMKREEQARLHVRQPFAASKSAIGHSDKRSSTSDEDWKRMVREVLHNKATQIRATEKKFPLRTLPGQV